MKGMTKLAGQQLLRQRDLQTGFRTNAIVDFGWD